MGSYEITIDWLVVFGIGMLILMSVLSFSSFYCFRKMGKFITSYLTLGLALGLVILSAFLISTTSFAPDAIARTTPLLLVKKSYLNTLLCQLAAGRKILISAGLK